MRIRKKSVALITNYYYEPGLAYQLYRVLYPNFNFTFISLFVPNTHFLDMEALNESPIPSQVFDMSDKNLDFGKASEDFLNRFIGELHTQKRVTKIKNNLLDFNYEESESPVTGFIEVSNPSLPLALSFYSSVFDTKMCRYFNDSKHYELSLLIYFDFYQYQLNLIIPNLQAYTYSYVDLLVSSYLNATNLQGLPLDCLQKTKIHVLEPTGHCNETNEMFYSKIVQRLNNSEPYLEQFNFYVTDNYPHCLAKYLKLNGVKADSYEVREVPKLQCCWIPPSGDIWNTPQQYSWIYWIFRIILKFLSTLLPTIPRLSTKKSFMKKSLRKLFLPSMLRINPITSPWWTSRTQPPWIYLEFVWTKPFTEGWYQRLPCPSRGTGWVLAPHGEQFAEFWSRFLF